MFDFIKNIFGGNNDEIILNAINEGYVLVDVRSPGEYEDGHVKGSINIPVDKMANHINELKNMGKIIVFCRSGNRSGMAKAILNAKGISDVIDAGTWTRVNEIVSNTNTHK
jgi:rhodanese-related sulfurtransferase